MSLASLHVTIAGLGLMGGSLALALRPHVRRLTAVEVDPAARTLALRQDVVDEATPDLAAGIRQADLVVLATPVRTIIRQITALPALRPQGCLLLDLGSTKQEICQAMTSLPDGFQAVGGHPLCGKETAGLAAAAAGLFQGQTFVLCPPAGQPGDAITTVSEALVAAIGAIPLWMSPAEHDELVALTSHLPYILAAQLMQQATAGAQEDSRVWPVSASGLHDMVRLAGSDPKMLADILLTNRPAVLRRLTDFQHGLAEMATLLQSGDEDALATWLARRHAEHQTYRRHKP